MRRIVAIVLVAWLASSASLVTAQDMRPPHSDPVGEQVFPPDLVLQHQKAIALTDAQRSALIAEIKRAQGSMVEYQADLARNVERLVDILKPDHVDEAQALGQLDVVLAAEREIKRQHIALAARIKNLLTAEQLRQLRVLRAPPAGK